MNFKKIRKNIAKSIGIMEIQINQRTEHRAMENRYKPKEHRTKRTKN